MPQKTNSYELVFLLNKSLYSKNNFKKTTSLLDGVQ
jgi:hypothetical protein